MRKFFIFLLIIMILICLAGSHYGYKYRNHYTPAIPSINTVNISDDIIEVKYDIEEYKKDKDIYCLKKFQSEGLSENDEWIKANDNKCTFEIDDNLYDFYIKNNYGNIIKVDEASSLGSIIDLSIDKGKIYLAIGSEHTPTLKITSVGNADKTILWKSSNDKVASVDINGKIKGLKKGNAKVTAKVMDKEISIDVVVTDLIIQRPKSFNNKKKYLRCNIYSKEDNDLLD